MTEEMPQHMKALAKANKVRLAAAAVKQEIREGKLGLREALDHEDVQSIELRHVLGALPRVGDSRARRIVVDVGIGSGFLVRPVRRLTTGQKERLGVWWDQALERLARQQRNGNGES